MPHRGADDLRTRLTEQDRLVIAGASLAGLRAAEAARKAGYAGEITLIGAEEHPPYNRPPLSKEFLCEDLPPDPVFRPPQALREQLEVDLRLGCHAIGLDARRRVLHCADGEVPYSALVVATGAQPRILPGTPAEGTEGMRGVYTLRTLDDARSVREALAAGARTVVVGAGFIGAEVASAVRKRGLPVTIVEAAPVPLGRSVGAQLGMLLADLHRQAGAHLRLGSAVQRIEGNEAVRAVLLDSGEQIPADLVVVGIGAAPCTGWLADSGVQLDPHDGSVLCDGSLATSVPGVYAAGDVCSWTSALLGRRLRLEHWTSAAEQGAAAGRNAADGGTRHYDTVPYFWSDWYGSRIQFAGEPAGADAEVIGGGWTGGRLLALYRRGDQFAGALTVNRPSLIMKLRRLIADRASWSEAVDFAAAKAVG
jgi:NADPH-dependent 2,4-dienoyl-CoA reductase/sulfur reductase-like enzyme